MGSVRRSTDICVGEFDDDERTEILVGVDVAYLYDATAGAREWAARTLDTEQE